jgi:hypothetical protein
MKQNNRKINACRLKASKLLDIAPRHMALCLSAALLLASPLACAQTRDDYCGATPAPGFDQPPNKAHSGRYVNKTYGYSLTIPAGFAAFTRASGPERGFTIELSAAPRAILSVDASYDAFYDITAAGVHRRDLNTISLHDAVISDEAADATLAKNAGGRFLLRVQCRGQAALAVHEEIIVLRNREIYRLDLQSTPERYSKDRQYLNAMLKSWRWEALQ